MLKALIVLATILSAVTGTFHHLPPHKHPGLGPLGLGHLRPKLPPWHPLFHRPGAKWPGWYQPDAKWPGWNLPDAKWPGWNQPDAKWPGWNQPDAKNPQVTPPVPNHPPITPPVPNNPPITPPVPNNPPIQPPITNIPQHIPPLVNNPQSNQQFPNNPQSNQQFPNNPQFNQQFPNNPQFNQQFPNNPQFNQQFPNNPQFNQQTWPPKNYYQTKYEVLSFPNQGVGYQLVECPCSHVQFLGGNQFGTTQSGVIPWYQDVEYWEERHPYIAYNERVHYPVYGSIYPTPTPIHSSHVQSGYNSPMYSLLQSLSKPGSPTYSSYSTNYMRPPHLSDVYQIPRHPPQGPASALQPTLPPVFTSDDVHRLLEASRNRPSGKMYQGM